VIWKNNIVAFRTEAFNFDEFKSGGLHEKLSISLKTGEIK
jgi:hypothetical protein